MGHHVHEHPFLVDSRRYEKNVDEFSNSNQNLTFADKNRITTSNASGGTVYANRVASGRTLFSPSDTVCEDINMYDFILTF